MDASQVYRVLRRIHRRELLVMGGDSTILCDTSGARQMVRGDRARFRGDVGGPHRLESNERKVLAIVGALAG